MTTLCLKLLVKIRGVIVKFVHTSRELKTSNSKLNIFVILLQVRKSLTIRKFLHTCNVELKITSKLNSNFSFIVSNYYIHIRKKSLI